MPRRSKAEEKKYQAKLRQRKAREKKKRKDLSLFESNEKIKKEAENRGIHSDILCWVLFLFEDEYEDLYGQSLPIRNDDMPEADEIKMVIEHYYGNIAFDNEPPRDITEEWVWNLLKPTIDDCTATVDKAYAILNMRDKRTEKRTEEYIASTITPNQDMIERIENEEDEKAFDKIRDLIR